MQWEKKRRRTRPTFSICGRTFFGIKFPLNYLLCTFINGIFGWNVWKLEVIEKRQLLNCVGDSLARNQTFCAIAIIISGCSILRTMFLLHPVKRVISVQWELQCSRPIYSGVASLDSWNSGHPGLLYATFPDGEKSRVFFQGEMDMCALSPLYQECPHQEGEMPPVKIIGVLFGFHAAVEDIWLRRCLCRNCLKPNIR